MRDGAAIPALAVLSLALTACGGEGPTLPADASAVGAEAVAWLDSTAMPVRTDEPTGDLSDLEFLREVVGDARVVGLGEATPRSSSRASTSGRGTHARCWT